mgnify:CR=1 FL=1
MNSSERGVLGEALVLSYLVLNGYEVFIPFGGKTNTDLVVEKDNVLLRVQIKSTCTKKKTGKYSVQIKKVRSNQTQNVISQFDNTKSDLLAVAILPESRVVLIETKSILVKNVLLLK